MRHPSLGEMDPSVGINQGTLIVVNPIKTHLLRIQIVYFPIKSKVLEDETTRP